MLGVRVLKSLGRGRRLTARLRRRRPRPARHGAHEGAAARGAVDGRACWCRRARSRSSSGSAPTASPTARSRSARWSPPPPSSRYLYWPVESLGWLLAEASNAAGATVRFFEVRDIPPAITDPPRPVALGAVRGELRPRGRPVPLPGRRARDAARGGPRRAARRDDGAGRRDRHRARPRSPRSSRASTTPPAGRVRSTASTSATCALAELRRVVATAFEDPVLISAQRRENVALGRAGRHRRRGGGGARVASADGFVAALPWGLDTRIGEQGLSLSGGQRQRLALARAVLGRPPRAGARRPALGAGRAHRGRGRGGAAPGAGRGHRAGRGAPAVDRAARRPGGDAARRRDRRRRHPPRAAGGRTRTTGRCWRARIEEVRAMTAETTADRSTTAGAASRTRRRTPTRRATGLRLQARARRLLGDADPPAPAGGGGGVAAARRAERGRAGGAAAGRLRASTRASPPRVAGDAAPLIGAIGGYAGSAAALGGAPRGLPAAHRADRAGRAARRAAPGVRARPAPLARLPRALHLRSSHLPPDQRRRRAERPAGEGARRLRRRGAVLVGDLGAAGVARPGAGRDRARRVRAALLLTRWFQRRSRATYRRTRVTVAAADRAVRRVDERHPRRAGLPPGGAQRRDLRRARRRLPRRQRRRRSARSRGTSGRCARSATSRWRWCSPSAATGWPAVRWSWARSPRSCSTCGGSTTRSTSWRMFFNSYQSAAAALEKIAAVLDTPPAVPEPAAPVRAAVAGARASCGSTGCGSPTGPTGGAPCCPSCR